MQTLLKQQVPIDTVVRYWRLSLALGVAIITAVVILLEILTRTAQHIEAGAAEIWRVGKLIANNTVHIPLLVRTNQIVNEISQAADGIAHAAERVQRGVAGDRIE